MCTKENMVTESPPDSVASDGGNVDICHQHPKMCYSDVNSKGAWSRIKRVVTGLFRFMKHDAKRPTRTEAPSGCDRLRRNGSEDRDWRGSGRSEAGSLGPQEKRQGRGRRAREETDSRGAPRNRQEGGCGEVVMMNAVPEIPKTARWHEAKSLADEFTKDYTVPPIPVIEIAESHGVDVVFADFNDYNNKVAGFCNFAEAKIYVNKNDIMERQMFTIAHEFGHWIMHKDYFLSNPDEYPILPRFQSVEKHNTLEQEANYFAANLLVPERLLRPVIDAPISALAKIFKVSRSMMENRVKSVRR